MGLAGWEGCSQLQGRATELSIRNWRRLQAAELGSGLPRNRTEGREVPGGYTMSCGVSLSMTIGEEQAAKWQIPKQLGRAVTERKSQEQGDDGGDGQASKPKGKEGCPAYTGGIHRGNTGKKRGNERIALQTALLHWLRISGTGGSAKSLLQCQLLGLKFPVSQLGLIVRSNKHFVGVPGVRGRCHHRQWRGQGGHGKGKGGGPVDGMLCLGHLWAHHGSAFLSRVLP